MVDARAARALAKARAVPGARIVARYPLVFEGADLKQPVAAEPAPRRFFDLADRPGRFARDDPAGHASQANPLRSGPKGSWKSADGTPLAQLDYFQPVLADQSDLVVSNPGQDWHSDQSDDCPRCPRHSVRADDAKVARPPRWVSCQRRQD